MNINKVVAKYGALRWVADDGGVFKFKRVLKGGGGTVANMMCANKDCKGSCRVRFDKKFDNDIESGVIIKQTHTATNCKKKNFSDIQLFRQKVLLRAATENTANSQIFQEELSKAPLSVRNAVSFKEIERSMQRAHQSNTPKNPESLSEFETMIILWEEKYGKINDEPFFLGRYGPDNEECLVAGIYPIANKIMGNCDWHLFGTFKCRPKEPKFAQLYVVMATAHERAFPIVWALMKSQTSKAYDVLFKCVKDHFPHLTPATIMSDYEEAVRASLKKHYPNARHVGCWFHFAQAIERNAEKLGINNGEKDGWNIAKRLMTTALLPPERIEEAVSVLEGLAQRSNQKDECEKLIQYFRSEWMGKVTVNAFSVFGQDNRTNNCQESLNRRINRTIRPQGNPWDFWRGLMEISVKEINYFNYLNNGGKCNRKKKMKLLLHDRTLVSLQSKLKKGEITVAEFMFSASHRITESQPSTSNEPAEGSDLYGDVEIPDEVVELCPLDILQENEQGPSNDEDRVRQLAEEERRIALSMAYLLPSGKWRQDGTSSVSSAAISTSIQDEQFPTSSHTPGVHFLTGEDIPIQNVQFLPQEVPSQCASYGTLVQVTQNTTLTTSNVPRATYKCKCVPENIEGSGVGPEADGNSKSRQVKPSSDPKGDGGAGSSKRPDPEGGKRQRGKVKKVKTAFDDDTDGDDPDEPQEDPFAMIEIEEPRIKQEVFDPEEFNEMESQGEEILPNDGSSGDKRNFETIYCTPTIIKEEVPDYVEIRMPSVGGEMETVAAVPEFEQAMIKPEPLDIIDENVDEDESEDEESETEPRDTSRLMWRCPLVSCTEMFSAELEMYQHLNLNHVVKGLALTSKSKKASAPRFVASSGTSGLTFLSSSSPRVSAVTTAAGRSIPTSSCGAITVTTTTLSYTSVTTTLTPRVSTVSSSTVTSVSSDALASSASPSPAATPALSTSAPNVTTSSGADASNSSTPSKPNPVTTSQGMQKLVVAPLNNKDPSLGQKFLLLAPNQSQQSQQVQLKAKAIPKPKPLQIFHSTPRSTEDVPDCAKDDSDMFSISLAEIPQNRRVPIKKKLVDVVDCVKLKNIDPDRLLIAFVDDSSDSRGT